MTDVKFPEDKELGRYEKVSDVQVEHRDSPSSAEPQPMRQIAFLLGLLWTCWIVACIADTLLSIDIAFFSFQPMSPLQYYLYSHGWYRWVFAHDRFHILEGRGLDKLCVASLTLCALLLIALSQIRRSAQDDIGSAITSLVMTILMAVGARIGAVRHEVDMIILPFTWLLVITISHFFKRAGIPGPGKKLGISKKIGSWLKGLGFAGVFGVHAWLFGFETDFVAIIGLWQGIGMVYEWLG